jgi:predicted membrane-bound spermidine synthase
LSLAIGFLSLSQEILWVRVVSFIFKGMSQSFALVLFFFLIGIAIGSAIGKRLTEIAKNLTSASAVILGCAAVVDFAILLSLPGLLKLPFSTAVIFFLITLTALLKSIMFPIAHHIGSQQTGGYIGRSVSRVYFCNIIGSTMGPLVTGYVLLDQLTLDECLLLLSLGTGLLAIVCAVRSYNFGVVLAGICSWLVIAILGWTADLELIPAIARATQPEMPAESQVEHVVQNRHGIIYTVKLPDYKPDIVVGNNAYDGRVSVNMQTNVSGLDRAMVLFAVHPMPERVLVIGLSTGAWARILSSSPRIKEMIAVEINPGYLNVIKEYEEVAGLLTDPRVTVIIDDGRRWLRRNPEESFDLIVMNTTFYWRAYSTNVLSREFLELLASHLRPGGIVGINSTKSGDVLQTARSVFPFVKRRNSFIYGSPTNDFRVHADALTFYRELTLNGKPVFEENDFSHGGAVRNMIDFSFVADEDQFSGLTPSPAVITDQNLLVEHAHGKLRGQFPRFFALVDQVRSWLDHE